MVTTARMRIEKQPNNIKLTFLKCHFSHHLDGSYSPRPLSSPSKMKGSLQF